MSKVQSILGFLRAKSDPSIDLALAQALSTADPGTIGSLADLLLERKHTQGGIALIEQFHRLPEASRQAILHDAPELTRPLRLAMRNYKTAGPANALNIIRLSASVRLAYLIPDLIRHGEANLQHEAALCLLEMAERTTHPGPEHAHAVQDPIETAFITSAVQEALRFFAQHQCKDVLQAMFSLPLPAVSVLLDSLKSLGEDWTRPTGIMLTRSDTLTVKRALLPALACEPLKPFALDGIALAVEANQPIPALYHWHLLKLPTVRRAVTGIRHTERFVPSPETFMVNALPGRTVSLVAFLTALPIEPHNLVRRLSQLQQAPDPATRLAAVRHLIGIAEQAEDPTPANHAIAVFCSDPQPGIVRIVVTHLIRQGYPDITKVLAHLINASDPKVQQIAMKRLMPIAFSKLWESWPRLDVEHRLAAGRALVKIDPMFHASLHDKLCMPDPAVKTRALSIITELNQGLLLQDMILRLCRDRDPHVVASAIRALGSADPKRVMPTIESALDHEDDRIRANAVEALGRLNTGQHVDHLVHMANEQEPNRARANAIQALMQMNAGEALKALSHMLADPRSEHRTSALWLVEAMGIAEVAKDVAEMSISEQDPKVRGRAGRVIQNIIALLSQPMPMKILDDPPSDAKPTPAPQDHAAAG